MPPKKKNVKRSRAVKKTPVVEPTLKVVEGEGLREIYQGIKDRINIIRNPKARGNEPTKRFNDFINSTDGKKIKSISVGRVPVQTGIQKVLDIISFGKFSKKRKELKYDDILHNYAIITYEDGSMKKIERNATVEAKEVSQKDLENLVIKVPVKKDLTTRDLLNNAVKRDKENDFWKYNAETSNCQEFTRELIDGSNLLPSDVNTNDVLQTQNAKELLDTIPAPLRGLPLTLTNTASFLDNVIYGGGLKGEERKDLIKARLFLDGVL